MIEALAGDDATSNNTPMPTNTPTATPVPTAPLAYDISMTYDALGNITSKTGMSSYGAQSASCPAGALDKAHAVVSAGGASYCYDRNGNLQSGAGWSYSCNADNTLASMTNGSAPESYLYDADGERVVRTAGGVTVVFSCSLLRPGARALPLARYPGA